MDTRVMVVGSAKTNEFQRRRPRIRLSGFWLNDIGFTCDSLVTTEYRNGSITLKLQGTGVETYKSVVKDVMRNKAGLFQVKHEIKNKKNTPHLSLKGFWLEEYDFYIGTVIIVQAEYGCIHVNALDLEKLGIKNKRTASGSR